MTDMLGAKLERIQPLSAHDLSSVMVVQLRERCRGAGLSVRGVKSILIDPLQTAEQPQTNMLGEKQAVLHPYTHTNGLTIHTRLAIAKLENMFTQSSLP
mmetsp:Transcript_19929/g.24408  ORF Transcript_19929/g.24408 Transcript_19929/m.24408 type:complete len:99 (+) Transcript_19929:228-524(+)